jgi:hypothetical protein
MGMAEVVMIVSITIRLATTTGMFFSAMRVIVESLMFVLTLASSFGWRGLRQKFLPAMFAAKVKRLPIAFRVERCRFIYRSDIVRSPDSQPFVNPARRNPVTK